MISHFNKMIAAGTGKSTLDLSHFRNDLHRCNRLSSLKARCLYLLDIVDDITPMLISYNNTDHLRVIEIILEKTIEYDDSSSDLKKDAKDIQFLTGKINIGHSVFLNAEEFLCINNWDYKGADWNLFYPEELQTEKSIIIGLHDSYLRFFLKRKFGVLEEEDMYNMNYLCYESFVMNTISLNRLFLRDGNMEEQSLANICRLFKDAKHINSRYEIIEDIIIFESLISGIELWGPLTSNIALIGFAIPLLEPFLRAVYRKGLPISTTLALINVNDDPSVRSLKSRCCLLGTCFFDKLFL